MAAEELRAESESEHLKLSDIFNSAEQEVQKLEKKLRKYILKTKDYFEQKENLVSSLKRRLNALDNCSILNFPRIQI